MNPTASPFDDAARVQLLHELRLLDATGESGWQALARLTSAHTGCSMGALSLVDSQRQWFAASHGFTASETPREHAFCSHAILSSDVMVVPDASVDPRFSANLLVAGGPVVSWWYRRGSRYPRWR